ncbi:MAG: hypothetical protein E7062_05385 [Spirochaetaceae bacterium]|nr:hypothetical protein [Spirochaetaceae bacterium]
MKLKITVFLLLITTSFSLFATDFEAKLIFDTYSAQNKIAVDFSFSERLSNNIFVDAKLMHRESNNYFAYCAGRFQVKSLLFSLGMGFDIQDSQMAPGVLANLNWKFSKRFSFDGNIFAGFARENLYKNQILDIDGGIIIHTENNNTKISYNFKRNRINSNEKQYHSGTISLLAFEKGLPFRIGLDTRFSFLFEETNPELFKLFVDVGGKIEFHTLKFGYYTVGGKARILDFSQTDSPLQFSLFAGIGFTLD